MFLTRNGPQFDMVTSYGDDLRETNNLWTVVMSPRLQAVIISESSGTTALTERPPLRMEKPMLAKGKIRSPRLKNTALA
jgi:hypothetical protein